MIKLFAVYTFLFSMIATAAVPTRMGNSTYPMPTNVIDLGGSTARFKSIWGGSVYSSTGDLQAQINSISGGAPSTRNINTTSPLSGGGDLSADRTIALTGIVPSQNGGTSTSTLPTNGQIPIGSTLTGAYTTANIAAGSSVLVANSPGGISISAPNVVPLSRVINTTTPISGGGSLVNDLTLALGIVPTQLGGTSTGALPTNGQIPIGTSATGAYTPANIAAGNSVAVANSAAGISISAPNVAPLSRAINTTSPLSGGGTLVADRTLSLTTVPSQLGGTSTATLPTDGQIPIGTTTTGAYTPATISAGNSVAVANSAAGISISAPNVTPLSRAINTTSPLSGGGTMVADRTLSLTTVPSQLGGTSTATLPTDGQIPIGTTSTGAYTPATIAAGNSVAVATSAGGLTISAPNVTPLSRAINTTSPLSGGGSLVTDRTLTLTTVPSQLGGTSTATLPTDGQIPIGTTSTGAYTPTTLTQGTGVTITNGAHSITIAATGSATSTVALLAQAVPTGTITSNTLSDAIFGTVLSDTNSAYNATTGVYTIPNTGSYQVSASLDVEGSTLAGKYAIIKIIKNTSTAVASQLKFASSTEGQIFPQIAINTPFTVGDKVKIQVLTNETSPTFSGGNSEYSYFSILQVK